MSNTKTKQDHVSEPDTSKSTSQSATRAGRFVLTRKQVIFTILTVALLGLGAVAAWVAGVFSDGNIAITNSNQAVNTNVVTNTATETPEAVVYARKLDGVIVDSPEKTDPHPIGVMIENLPVVRPQSGLAAGSVVYEALAEGGATRFLVMMAGADPALAKIGPVRSARPYYIEWNSEYDGLYAHAGGSPDALEMISGFGIKDLNGIGREGKYFWRDRSISAPHNLFTSSELLYRALSDKQLTNLASTFIPWNYKEDSPLADRPDTEPYIRIKFSGYAYETEWRYRKETNTYARFNAGLPHEDAQTGEQIQAKNVIVQIVPPILDIGEKGRLTLDVHGTGKALIHVDGGLNVGTWKKDNRTSRTEFFYENGDPVQLNRGATWIAVVPVDRTVEYGSTR